jgi:hypothetical protein
MKDLNIRPETLKLLWENTEYLSIGNNFISRTPVAQEIKARIGKCDCIKLKSFCSSKEAITRMKR